MKLRNILGVSALTLLLGMSMSGLSANAADKESGSPNTTKANATVNGGSLKLGNAQGSLTSQITLSDDNGSTRNVTFNKPISIPITDGTGSGYGWSLSVKGSNMPGSTKFNINSGSIKKNVNNNNPLAIATPKSIENVNINMNGQDNLVASADKNSGEGSNDFNIASSSLNIDPNGNNLSKNGSGFSSTYNPTLTWTLAQGKPSSSGK